MGRRLGSNFSNFTIFHIIYYIYSPTTFWFDDSIVSQGSLSHTTYLYVHHTFNLKGDVSGALPYSCPFIDFQTHKKHVKYQKGITGTHAERILQNNLDVFHFKDLSLIPEDTKRQLTAFTLCGKCNHLEPRQIKHKCPSDGQRRYCSSENQTDEPLNEARAMESQNPRLRIYQGNN